MPPESESQTLDAPAVRSMQARTLFPSVWVWAAVHTPPGQSSIQPLGLAIDMSARSIPAMEARNNRSYGDDGPLSH